VVASIISNATRTMTLTTTSNETNDARIFRFGRLNYRFGRLNYRFGRLNYRF